MPKDGSINMDNEAKISQIERAQTVTSTEAQFFADIIKDYFDSGRPSSFEKYERPLTNRLPQFLKFVDFDGLIVLIQNFFLFCRTNNPQKNTDDQQQQISEEVLRPFLRRVEEIIERLELDPLSYPLEQKNVIIQTRHALTQGTYAPGKQIYAVARALLGAGFKVKVFSYGEVDEEFKALMASNPHFQIAQKQHLKPLEQLFDLRSEAFHFRPCAIFTDQEIGVLTAVEAIGLSSKCFLLSAGFYRVPWYSKIMLTEELMTSSLMQSDRFHPIPQTLLIDNLAPKIDHKTISEVKVQLGLGESFVIGSFARYEMFSEEFLRLLDKILQNIKNAKVILAGTNDQSLAKRLLKKHIAAGRVNILGPSKTAIVGYVCDVFLDTFPTVTGYAALESMAKGKPVLTLNCENLQNYRENRLEELIFNSKDDLAAELALLAVDANRYQKFSIASKNFMLKIENLDELTNALLSQLKITST